MASQGGGARIKKSVGACVPLDPSWQTRAFGQHYSVGAVSFFLRLVLNGNTSLRAGDRVFSLIGELLPMPSGEPDWTTGRWWLLRVGLAMLLEPKEHADDWFWLIDHSAQIGQEKCLVILGVRAANLPAAGTCLRYQDLKLIRLRIMKDPDKQAVAAELEAASKETGVPRCIVDDHGADIHGGVKLFQEKHPETAETYDITHRCACLLKRYLEKDERWTAFSRQVGYTKTAVQQTELACLAPPHQRTKARYMNLETVLAWGSKTLAVLEQPPPELLAKTSAERLEQKLGWLADYREMLAEWSEWHAVVIAAESTLRQNGLEGTTPIDLARQFRPLAQRDSTRQFARELKAAVASEALQLRTDERLVASTEVLESCFGKLKVLEKDQSRQGFTGMVLAIGALFSKLSSEVVHWALETCPVRTVKDWIAKNIGRTVQAQRRLVYQNVGAPALA